MLENTEDVGHHSSMVWHCLKLNCFASSLELSIGERYESSYGADTTGDRT